MPHKFFYLFKIKGEIDELDNINESSLEIEGNTFKLRIKDTWQIKSIIKNYYFTDQEEINGNILINEENSSVPFKIRSKSKLLFIETPYQRERLKILKFFNSKFKKLEIGTFVPTTKDEIDFICKAARSVSFKVFINDEIVRSTETNEDICDGLKKNMELIEVALDMPIKNKNVTFYYYGNAIQFPTPEEDTIEGVIQSLENTMVAHAK